MIKHIIKTLIKEQVIKHTQKDLYHPMEVMFRSYSPRATVLQLDGSGSFYADGRGLSFSWALIYVPQGSTAQLNNQEIVNATL